MGMYWDPDDEDFDDPIEPDGDDPYDDDWG